MLAAEGGDRDVANHGHSGEHGCAAASFRVVLVGSL